jgi:putative acetyltransferase
MGEIVIVPFRPQFARAFSSLNEAWIEQFFTLEAADLKVLRDPEAAIIAKDGAIFFALDDHAPVGTVAALRVSPVVFELAKMAVTPSHQGRGIGQRLGRAAVEHARSHSAEYIFLETNDRLPDAIRLYERLGFVHATPPRPSVYARSNVYMELRFRPRSA